MTAKSISIPITIIDLHGDGYHPIVDIKVFGKPFKAVLDTGASRTAFDHALLLQADPEADIHASERLSTGLGTNTMQSHTAWLHNIKIGKFVIPEIEVAVLDLSSINHAYAQMGHPQVLGVIGSDIMMRYDATISYSKRKLFMKY